MCPRLLFGPAPLFSRLEAICPFQPKQRPFLAIWVDPCTLDAGRIFHGTKSRTLFAEGSSRNPDSCHRNPRWLVLTSSGSRYGSSGSDAPGGAVCPKRPSSPQSGLAQILVLTRPFCASLLSCLEHESFSSHRQQDVTSWVTLTNFSRTTLLQLFLGCLFPYHKLDQYVPLGWFKHHHFSTLTLHSSLYVPLRRCCLLVLQSRGYF